MGKLYIVMEYSGIDRNLFSRVLHRLVNVPTVDDVNIFTIPNYLKHQDVMVYGTISNIYQLKQITERNTVILLLPENCDYSEDITLRYAVKYFANHTIISNALKDTSEQAISLILEERSSK